MKQFIRAGTNVYTLGAESTLYYGLFRIAGHRNKIKRRLASIQIRAAIQEVREKQSDHDRWTGIPGKDPFAKKPVVLSVGMLLIKWRDASFPDAGGEARKPAALESATNSFPYLHKYFQKTTIADLEIADCRQYMEWRVKQITKGTGRRTADLDLTNLSNCLNWATSLGAKHGGIKYNPIRSGRPRFQTREHITHASDHMAANAEDLHALAAHMLAEPTRAAQTHGWQLLFEAFTGARTSEALKCRWDAKRGQAGYMDQNYIWIQRSKRGENPEFPIIDRDLPEDCPDRMALTEMLTAFRAWRGVLPVLGPDHFFPGRVAGSTSTLSRHSLGRSLREAAIELGMDHITPHSMRAYYVNVLRKWRVPDTVIGWRLGHRSGVQLIENTYGKPMKVYDAGLRFLPETSAPAWEPWTHQDHERKIINL